MKLGRIQNSKFEKFFSQFGGDILSLQFRLDPEEEREMGDWDRSSVLGTRRGIISQPQGRNHAALAAVRRLWNSCHWREEDEQEWGLFWVSCTRLFCMYYCCYCEGFRI
ncbi:hypothetical protein AABB24_016504, partial [Solanum stoloniferum]